MLICLSNFILKNVQQSKIPASVDLNVNDTTMLIILSGDWSINSTHISASEFIARFPSDVKMVNFDVSALGSYDSSLISFVLRICTYLQSKEISVNLEALPEGIDSMLYLATAVPSAKTSKNVPPINFINLVGTRTINLIANMQNYVCFFGDITIAFVKMLFAKARMRRVDLLAIIQKCGPEALAIVALISFLVGLILAFVGSIQLAKYGSEIFVADLVGIAMVREMGAMMVGIVMSGRTGASFAAELGTMKVNEEISAFRTFGISPIEFLVLPRIIALVFVFPLLTIFADVIGMLGGLVIGVGMFDLSYEQYASRTFRALNIIHLTTGVAKSVVYGLIVACVGCRMGLSCENSSSGVGKATTSAVVQSITWIIVADAIFAVVFTIFDI